MKINNNKKEQVTTAIKTRRALIKRRHPPRPTSLSLILKLPYCIYNIQNINSSANNKDDTRAVALAWHVRPCTCVPSLLMITDPKPQCEPSCPTPGKPC